MVPVVTAPPDAPGARWTTVLLAHARPCALAAVLGPAFPWDAMRRRRSRLGARRARAERRAGVVRGCIAAPCRHLGPMGHCWDPTEGPSVAGTDEPRRPIDQPSRANPSRGGDAKPGISVTRPPGCRPDRNQATDEVASVKAILARFTVALTLLASMALTLGAGVKWM